MNAKEKWLKAAFWIGLATVLAYWLAVHPPGAPLGYAEDMGGIEISRQIMADNLREFGWPHFFTHRLMHPTGITAAYYSWALERDGLGALFWMWNPSFPFLWVYFGLSLFASYLGAGYLMRRMKLAPVVAWGLAALVTVVNLPRHFAVYYHYEHLPAHWVYLSLFLDAWIWQCFWREKKFSWNLEVWRAVLGLGTFGIAGYFWGPMILEWAILRICLLSGIWKARRETAQVPASPVEIEGFDRRAILPGALLAFLFALDLSWFVPLAKEALKLGEIGQGLGWFGTIQMVFRPAWLEYLIAPLQWISPAAELAFRGWLHDWRLSPINWLETVVTIGWLYWVPVVLSIVLVRRKRGGPGAGLLKPILWYLALTLLYLRNNSPRFIHTVIRAVVPFMAFFRVPSRMGLFLTPIAGAIIALAWPELSAWFKGRWARPGFKAAFAVFVLASVGEAGLLTAPVVTMEPLKPAMRELLESVKSAPGTAVLDLPFCLAGGNGVCGLTQCPNYGASVTPIYMTFWHEKQVYGVYESRLVDAQCQIYNSQPYLSWFDAWARQRCLTPTEWDQFCSYLDAHSEIGTVLAYSIWKSVEEPACAAAFREHLGPVIHTGDLYAGFERGTPGIKPTRVYQYAGKCRRVAPRDPSRETGQSTQ